MITFGNKEKGQTYIKREAAYGIIVRNGKVAVAKTPRGCFLPGGGIETGESNEVCVVRECEEELGIVVAVDEYLTSSTLFDRSPKDHTDYEMIGHYYYAHDTGETVEKIEEDHTLMWMTFEEARRKLKIVHHAWVMEILAREASIQSGKVPTVVCYNPHWYWWYMTIERELIHGLGDGNIYKSIEHVGSTSIDGMNAKPVIDVDIIISDGQSMERIIDKLSMMGYVHQGNQGIDGREVFKRDRYKTYDSAELDEIPHHLYVCHESSDELKRHLSFRDQLNNCTDLRDEYNAIKDRIIDEVGLYNRASYVAVKAEAYQSFFDKVHTIEKRG